MNSAKLKKDYVRSKYQLDTGTKSRVRQSEKDSTDINKIMERFNRTGKLPAMQTKNPQFLENMTVSFDQALMIVKQAQEAFNELPAKTRKFFENSPQKLSEFISDPNNAAQAVELGLMEYMKPSEQELLSDIAQNLKPKATETDKK